MTELELRLERLIFDMLHPIAYPGEYGIGNEPQSYILDPAGALNVLCEFVDKAIKLIGDKREQLDDWAELEEPPL